MSTALVRIACFILLCICPLLDAQQLTDPLRKEQESLQDGLQKISQQVANLGPLTPQDQKLLMAKIALYLQTNIKPHLKWEEAVLYPVVDQIANGIYPFTTTLRYEHIIINRWIDDLSLLADSTSTNLISFQRRAYYVLGVINANFETEEQVLFPIIDKTMTPQQFQNQIMNSAAFTGSQ